MIWRPESPRHVLAVHAPPPSEDSGYESSVRSSHGRVLVHVTGSACEYLKLGHETSLQAIERCVPLIL